MTNLQPTKQNSPEAAYCLQSLKLTLIAADGEKCKCKTHELLVI